MKLIKTYLRNTMGQERLTNVAVLSFEQEELENVDFSKLVNNFAMKNARKCYFECANLDNSKFYNTRNFQLFSMKDCKVNSLNAY